MSEQAGIQELSTTAPLRGRRLGSLHDDAYTVLLRPEILEEILEFSESDLTRELGGFLLGSVRTDRELVEVRNFLQAGETHSRAASLTFTHRTWARMNREIAERYPDLAVVGWHHTHPGLGIFLSQYDLFIQRNFFSEPWQIAMVVDPRKQEFGVFQWKGQHVVDCGFVCLDETGAAASPGQAAGET